MALGDGVSALAMLGVTFGGFSPTLMDGVESSKELVEHYEQEQAKRKEMRRRQRELEFARTSKVKQYQQDAETAWDYVVVDEKLVRLVRLHSKAESISIPPEIEGLRVYELAPQCCSENDFIENITCPDAIDSIGAYAFRYNPQLRSIVLPKGVGEFSANWFQGCPRLKKLVMPGMLDEIKAEFIDVPSLESLEIGPSLAKIEPGSFRKSNLKDIRISDQNPYLKTDGRGIYSKDGALFLALAVPVERYEVLDGCTTVAKKACYGIERLRQVTLPETLVHILSFAFSHTGLVECVCPHGVQEIEEKAFLSCRALERVTLNEGLKSIGDSAFEQSKLGALEIPGSIEHIGKSFTAHTNIVHSGPNATLSISEDSKDLFLDGNGGLYKHEADGDHMVQLLDPDIREYNVMEGTVAINDQAFAFHGAIESIVVPDGVTSIGNKACRICRTLKRIEIPDSVREIGDEAFLDTSIEEFRIPASLEKLGKKALITYGAHYGENIPSLSSIIVDPHNKAFYVESGMLCRKNCDGKGNSSVVVFTSSESHVEIPSDVVLVEEFAFNNARGIDYLGIKPELSIIETGGLATWCWIRHIHVELAKAVEGRTVFDFFFPDTYKSMHGISTGIGGSSWVNVPAIMAQYDVCIASARDYNAPRKSDNISAYEQVNLILGRFDDPILLTTVNRGIFERTVRNHLLDMCEDIARHDDRSAIDKLVAREFIHADNIDAVIERVSRLQDAAMTAYLLEIKRLRFNRAIIDFDL